jgi:endoglucanase
MTTPCCNSISTGRRPTSRASRPSSRPGIEWIYTAFRLYESHGIGWNFWPWKKIDTVTSPVSVVPPVGWDGVVASIDDADAIDRETAERVFGELLVALRIENCVWQPEVVAALLAEAPTMLPAWGFGYRGAGESYSSRRGNSLAGIRTSDAVDLQWAREGDNPPNPFEQSDGRAYLPTEELVVALEQGDWLEFELVGMDDAQVLDASGGNAAVRVERSERGLRVVAESATTVARIIPSSTTRSW